MKGKVVLAVATVLALFVAAMVLTKSDPTTALYGWMVRDTLQQRQHEALLAGFETGAETPAAVPHFAAVLRDARSWSIPGADLGALPSGGPLLLTVEAWGSRLGVDVGGGLRAIARGDWDAKIDGICGDILSRFPDAWVRFNPEMEVPAGRYPWENNPVDYIAAFRGFAERLRACAPRAKVVWAPAGYPGVLEFWPGAEFVDAVSVTLKSDGEWASDAYPREESVFAGLRRKLHRLRFIESPVLVLGSRRVAASDFDDGYLAEIARERAAEPAVYNASLLAPRAVDAKALYPELQLGVYDPELLLTDEPSLAVEHLFADFDSLADGRFERELTGVLARGHDVIVTAEAMYGDARRNDPAVLEKTLAGDYDHVFRPLLARLAGCGRRVYLRFAHEMEIPIKRYPWQSQDPVLYIKAFRYFMDLIPASADNIVRVWGPAGDRGSLEWWPGEDVVDLISIAIYGLPDKNITDPERQEQFRTIFNRKMYRMRFVAKPVFITEFGVKGPEQYQDRWLVGAAQTIRENPQVVGINYFNMVDTPKAWGEAIKPPDWSISRASFRRFAEALGR